MEVVIVKVLERSEQDIFFEVTYRGGFWNSIKVRKGVRGVDSSFCRWMDDGSLIHNDTAINALLNSNVDYFEV